MFFFIGGVSPKLVKLPAEGRFCPTCGGRMVYERLDHVFSVFFIPLLTVSKGVPALMCDRCDVAGQALPGTGMSGCHSFKRRQRIFPG